MSINNFPNTLSNTPESLGNIGVCPPDAIRYMLSFLPAQTLDSISQLNKTWNCFTNSYCRDVTYKKWAQWCKKNNSTETWIGKYIYKARLTDNFQRGFFKTAFLEIPTTFYAKVEAVKGETVAVYRRTGTLCVTPPQRYREQVDIIRSRDGLILRSLEITGAFHINSEKLYVVNKKNIEVWDWHSGDLLNTFPLATAGKIGRLWVKNDYLFFVTVTQKYVDIFADEQVINDVFFLNHFNHNPIDEHINGLYNLNLKSAQLQKYELLPTLHWGKWKLLSRYVNITDTTFSALFYDSSHQGRRAIKEWPIVADMPPEEEIPATMESHAQPNTWLLQWGGITFTINPNTLYAELHKNGIVFAEQPGWQFECKSFDVDDHGTLIISMANTADNEKNPPRKLTAWNVATGKKLAEMPIQCEPHLLRSLKNFKVLVCEPLDQQTTKVYVLDLKNGSVLEQRTIPMYIGIMQKNDYFETSYDGEKLAVLHHEPNLIGIRQHICVFDFTTKETDSQKLEETFPIHASKETKIGEIANTTHNMYAKNIPATTNRILDLFKHTVNLIQAPVWKAIKWILYVSICVAAVIYVIVMLIFEGIAYVFRQLANRITALIRG